MRKIYETFQMMVLDMPPRSPTISDEDHGGDDHTHAVNLIDVQRHR